MSEQYRCSECGHFVEILDDAICDVCNIGKMQHLRYIRGGDGSHWEGCEDMHWDCKIAQLEDELARKDEQIEKLEDALHKISNWCKAYPLEIADEPTEDEWKTAHAIMNQHGWSLTTFVVSGMRRVTNGIAEIADLGG